MRGEGPAADLIRQLFHVSSRQLGLNQDPWPVSTAAFARPGRTGGGRQLELFESEAGGFHLEREVDHRHLLRDPASSRRPSPGFRRRFRVRADIRPIMRYN